MNNTRSCHSFKKLIYQLFFFVVLLFVCITFIIFNSIPKVDESYHDTWNNIDIKAPYNSNNVSDQSSYDMPRNSDTSDHVQPVLYNKKNYIVTINYVSSNRTTDSCTNITYDLNKLKSENNLIYNMVPKCASYGVRKVLVRLRQRNNFFWHEGSYKYPYEIIPQHHSTDVLIKMLSEDMRFNPKQLEFYFKHIHFMDFSLVKKPTPYYINVIRDPVEHFISLYYFQKAHPEYSIWGTIDDPRRKANLDFIKNMTLDECVQNSHFQCTEAGYLFTIIPFFCGHDLLCLAPSQLSLDKAKENVIKYFPVVGYVEQLKDFFQLSAVIWPQYFTNYGDYFSEKHFQKHETRQRKEPSLQSKEILTKRLFYEYEFYTWIKDRFQCMYEKYV